jgi:hypothetical protein
MNDFICSRPGRVFTGTLSVLLTGSGLSTLLHGDVALLVLAVSLFSTIVIGFIGMGWVGVDNPRHGGLGLILTPLSLLLATPFTLHMARYGHELGEVWVIGGVALAAWAVRPRWRARSAVEARTAGSGPMIVGRVNSFSNR